MNIVTETAIVIACAVGIVVGAFWINKNVSYGCIDLGFVKHCGVTSK
jgi:hypothetical protein